MTRTMNLKELERQAFKSYYQDGVWDLYLGFLIAIMPLSGLLTDWGASKTVGLLTHLVLTFGACILFIFAKKNVTAPRLGLVDFNSARKARNTHLKYILGSTATLGALLFGLILIARHYEIAGVLEVFSNRTLTGIGFGLFLTGVFSVMAFLMDFTRAYIMGVIFGAGVGSAMILDTAAFMVGSGLVFVILGSVLFVRFLNANPVSTDDCDF